SPQAPVAGAVYLGRTGCKSVAVPFPSLASGQVVGPSGEFAMLIGPENGNSRDGFTVKLAEEANPPLAIDRLGVTRFNGDVTISGYRACAHIPISANEMLVVHSIEPGDAGEKLHLRIDR